MLPKVSPDILERRACRLDGIGGQQFEEDFIKNMILIQEENPYVANLIAVGSQSGLPVAYLMSEIYMCLRDQQEANDIRGEE